MKAIVLIDGDVNAKTRVDVETNGVHPAIIYEAADQLMRHFAGVMVAEARKVVGDDDNAISDYLDWMLKQQKVGKGNHGGPSISDLAKGN